MPRPSSLLCPTLLARLFLPAVLAMACAAPSEPTLADCGDRCDEAAEELDFNVFLSVAIDDCGLLELVCEPFGTVRNPDGVDFSLGHLNPGSFADLEYIADFVVAADDGEPVAFGPDDLVGAWQIELFDDDIGADERLGRCDFEGGALPAAFGHAGECDTDKVNAHGWKAYSADSFATEFVNHCPEETTIWLRDAHPSRQEDDLASESATIDLYVGEALMLRAADGQFFGIGKRYSGEGRLEVGTDCKFL